MKKKHGCKSLIDIMKVVMGNDKIILEGCQNELIAKLRTSAKRT
jgi:hypothetical protein